MPRGFWPSTNRTAPAGYAAVNLIFSHASSDCLGRPQKKLSVRNLQMRQFSTNSRPYGDPTLTPFPITELYAGSPKNEAPVFVFRRAQTQSISEMNQPFS